MPGILLEPFHHHYRTAEGRRVPGVTESLRYGGHDHYAAIDPATLAFASERGKAGHSASHLDDLGLLDETTVDPIVLPYLNAWRRFRALTGFEPLLIEERVYNPVYDYGGTLDRTGTIDGQLYLIDLKTGMSFDSFRLQVVAYNACLAEPLRYNRMVVQLCSDSTFTVHHFDRSTYHHDLAAFLTALKRARPIIEQQERQFNGNTADTAA